MKIKQGLLIIALPLLFGCSGGGVSQNNLEDLLTQARVDAAAKQYDEAKKKLHNCLQHAHKEQHLFVTLSALNQLVDIETEQHKYVKAKAHMLEAGEIAEAYSKTGEKSLNSAEPRLLKEAIRAMNRLADNYAEFGRYDAARSLYLGTKAMQRADIGIEQEDSAENRLQKLETRISSEKQAIEHEDGLSDVNDPKYHARIERIKAKRSLMNEMKALTGQMIRDPKTETLDKMFPLAEKIRTTFGEREGEYRATLSNLINYSSLYGRREKALALLNEDLARFDNIDMKKLIAADPTTLENSNFLITDLNQYCKMMMQKNNYEETRKAALRGIKLAEDIEHVDSEEFADLLKAAAWERERRGRQEEAISYRHRQITMLEKLNLTGNYPPYYEARLELGHDLIATGHAKDALPQIEYAIRRLKANQPNGILLAYAYTTKAECLRTLGDLEAARKCMLEAQKIWETSGTPDQKFACYRVFSKVARELKRYDEAYEMGLKALNYCKKLPADKRLVEYPDAYYELALVEMERNRFKEAETYGRKALEAHLNVKGKANFGAAGILNFIALAITRQGNFAEAERVRLRALQYCRESTETPRTPELSTLLQLANFYQEAKKKEKGEAAYREVISTAEKLRGAEEMKDQYAIHYLRMCRIQLAQLIRENKPQDAKRLKDQSMESISVLRTADPVSDCDFLISLGGLCLNLNDYQNAEKVLNEAEKVANSTTPPLKDWLIAVFNKKKELYRATKSDKLMLEAADRVKRLKNSPGGH